RDDGFFITGDLATMSDDGYVTIVGRGKDLIISGGYNIYPKELESLIDDQPNVVESAVIGVADRDLGEVAVAVVVGTANIDALKATVERDMARFKHPRAYHFVDALPRNAMGKVQKNILRDQFGAT
ncbi:MAG: AMP-binding enzyme, partial [Planktomarina sp.]